MTRRSFRIVTSAAAALASGVALLACLAAPQLGVAYARLLGPLGTALPRLTAELSLPLLGVAPGGPHQAPAPSPGAAAVWLLFVLAPWAVLVWSWRAGETGEAVVRWVVGWSLLLPVLAAVAGLVALGLLLPFGCL